MDPHRADCCNGFGTRHEVSRINVRQDKYTVFISFDLYSLYPFFPLYCFFKFSSLLDGSCCYSRWMRTRCRCPYQIGNAFIARAYPSIRALVARRTGCPPESD
ncbi:hypothetical protein CPB83DRAFT_72191 [Crepidotus variabilis]|uniref:Uncharacterized protein n=1 Tax=Crepidotus variabilis TaxID=179855 RepID=A0A9P6E5D2_9AGAR|nr:hypothetical protein CPB83DRAFT_72191 [Crepidotus variabilis]